MAISNLTTQYISSSFQNLMQVSSSGQIYNGLGTQVTNLVLTSVSASFYGSVTSASAALTANTANSASYATTASYIATASYALSTAVNISNLATTGSNTFIGNQNVTGNVNITGNLTANTYILSSSVTNMTVEYASGSTAFGNSSDDTHTFIGSVTVTGSFLVSGSSTFRNIGPAQFTGSVISTQGFTGSLSGTAATSSYISPSFISASVASSGFGSATPASASYALTASYISPTFISASAAAAGFGSGGAPSVSASYAVTSSYSVSASVAMSSSYISATFISASAAASGFGAAGSGGVTINNNTDNYIVTATGTPNTVNGESNLTFDGTNLVLTGSLKISGSIEAGSVVGSDITTSVNSDDLQSGTFYPVDPSSGAITITLKPSTVGTEFTFFAKNLTNDISFTNSSTTIYSEDSYLKMNKAGSAVTVKYYVYNRIALIGSLKA